MLLRNKILVALAGVVILGVGGLAFISSQFTLKPSSTAKPTNAPTQQNTSINNADSNQSNDGYIEYSKSVLDQAANSRRVLFFYANWCPTCRPIDAELKENTNNIPEGVTVIRVNYSDTDTDKEEKDLAGKYGVTYQHTFVFIDQDGNEITKWNGGGLDQIISKTKI
jgi:thioredoxin 1